MVRFQVPTQIKPFIPRNSSNLMLICSLTSCPCSAGNLKLYLGCSSQPFFPRHWWLFPLNLLGRQTWLAEECLLEPPVCPCLAAGVGREHPWSPSLHSWQQSGWTKSKESERALASTNKDAKWHSLIRYLRVNFDAHLLQNFCQYCWMFLCQNSDLQQAFHVLSPVWVTRILENMNS